MKRPRLAKTILKKNNVGGLFDFKIYYKVAVIVIV